ncbi:BRCT-containing protein 1 [Mycena sanguinolenta]|uniref:BRCT-containing protein 1 n=1 Tax=Mycena sanguinolenta TaxID=230812 RepID=A0A8H6Z9B5_9AGAR|nr:BRCT-containing protein 1 [Mycena sanguinolenta]
MATDTRAIFRGVVYHIYSEDYDLIRFLLEHHGGEEADEPEDATRIIVDPQHLASFELVERSAHNATIVSPEWVYSSVKYGAKRPSQYYSADPALIFSSTVVTSFGQSDFIRTAVTTYGGQWLPTLADDVTHLIAGHSVTDRSLGLFRPIVVPFDWLIHSIVEEVRLPVAPYESQWRKSGRDIISAARLFCEALYFDHKEEAEDDSTTEASIPSDGPVPSLPFEILAKIFVELRDDALDTAPSLTRAVLGVSQVCRYWRNVAHGTGELWTHLRFTFHSKKHYHHLRKLVQQWVVRSHPRALSFTIRSCYPHAENPIIQVLLRHASRIRDLSLELPAAHFIPFFQAPTGSFPLLYNLNISVLSKEASLYNPELGLSRYEYFEEYDFGLDGTSDDEDTLWETMAAPMTSLQNAPRLESVKITASCFFRINLHTFPLAWGNLTELDFHAVALSVLDTAHFLPQCTRLKRLKFMTEGPSALIIPLPRVRLLQLTTVDWSGLEHDGISVFDQLILPRLTKLSLFEGSSQSLLRVYKNSSFALRELSLSCVYTTFRFLSAFLRSMPSLVSFAAPLSSTDEFLVFLTYDERRNRVLPKLERLDVCHDVQHFSAAAVLRMLESRWGNTPLERSKIYTKSPKATRTPAPADIRG